MCRARGQAEAGRKRKLSPSSCCIPRHQRAANEYAGYAFLSSIFALVSKLNAFPGLDYVPQVDLSRFPREDVRFPDAGENTHRAWAWRCSIRDEHSRGNTLLDGRTIAIKDMINVKDVPMLMGTTFVKVCIPVELS